MTIEILEQHTKADDLALFFEHSVNGGLFHDPVFLNYHGQDKFPSPAFQPYHFVFREDGRIIGFIPGALVRRDDGYTRYMTPFASSYGGLVFGPKLVFKDFEEIMRLFLEELTGKVDEIVYAPEAAIYAHPSEASLNYQHFLLHSSGFTVKSCDMILAVRSSGLQDLEKRFHKKIQTELRQALRNGLRMELSRNVEQSVYDLLLKSQERLGGKPTHTLEELNRINTLCPERLLVFKTMIGDDLAGGIICFVVNRRVLNTFYIFDEIEHRNLKPNHFGYFEVLRYAFSNGFDYLDFGPGTSGNTPNYPLIFFKEKFDSEPFLRTVYSKDIAHVKL